MTRWMLAAALAAAVWSACVAPQGDLQGPAHPVEVVPEEDAGGEAGQDGGTDAGTVPCDADAGLPSCDPTLSWTPRAFPGPTFHVAPSVADAGPGSGTAQDPWTDLQHAVDQAPEGAVLQLAAGTYSAPGTAYTDPSCGNCAPDQQREVPATRGFLLTGKSLALHGAGQGQTVLRTNAGYGVLIEDAPEVYLADLTITGGTRDADGAAADGAVVVRRSKATLHRVAVRDNTALGAAPNQYPGIAGLMLRDGANVLVMQSVFDNNSWDGISVYGDGKLRLFGSTVSRGNGVAVGVTWSGRALLVNNDLNQYWKGLGSFVDAVVEAKNNRIHHHIGWGAWVTQNARLELVNNTIAWNDLIGVALIGNGVSGRVVNNAIAYNGLWTARRYAADAFGTRVGLWGDAPDQSAFSPGYNVLYANQLNDWALADGTSSVPPASMGTSRAADPLFFSSYNFQPKAGSALIDSGDPSIRDLDGTVSDVGATGGPDAQRIAP